MWYLGIDPGRKGAFAMWNPDADEMHLRDMPDTPMGVYELVRGMSNMDIKMCMLEKPLYMERTGVRNVSVMAFNFGVLYLSLTVCSVPFKEVAPGRWKKQMDLSSDKRESLKMAQALFPTHKDSFKLMKDNDRAEAALLAYYSSKNGVIKR
jgi:hypothetical protein